MNGMRKLTNAAVVAGLEQAVRLERESIVEVIRWLIEFDRRQLLDDMPYPSLFAYCLGRLRYTPDEAYKRLRVAKEAAKYPEILELLDARRTDLSRLVTIAPHLDGGNAPQLLEKACSLSQHALESFVAGFAPRLIARDVVRRIAPPPAPRAQPEQAAQDELPAGPKDAALPAVATPQPSPAPQPLAWDKVEPLTEVLSRIAFTADAETVRDLERALKLLKHRRANLGPLIGRALKALLREIDPDVRLANKKPQKPKPAKPGAKRIPQHVRDAVWRRDEGQCTFRDENGQRCDARTELEFDHIRPLAAGGKSEDPDGIRLLCRHHNQAAAREWFGADYVAKAIESSRANQPAAGRGRPPPPE